MDPYAIIAKHCRTGSKAHRILVSHGEQVAAKALQAAAAVADQSPDRAFIREAALLHDIGMLYTDSPSLGCYGSHPYIVHGIIGRALLLQEGLERHGRVCERHVGVGLTREDIETQRLVLPLRDMVPVTLEEELICYADKFFSKVGDTREKPVVEILAKLSRYGAPMADRFRRWAERFGG